MKDILVIFTVLLLLLIIISTLGGSLSFIGKNGSPEYFTEDDAAKKLQAKQPFTQHVKPKPPVTPVTPTNKPVPSTQAPVTEPFGTDIKEKPPTGEPSNIEAFEGPMYATA